MSTSDPDSVFITAMTLTIMWFSTTKDKVASVQNADYIQSDLETQKKEASSDADLTQRNRRKQLNDLMVAHAEKTRLVEVEGGDVARKQDVEFDKIANARGKHLVEGFEKLETIINQGKNPVLAKRVKSLVESVIVEKMDNSIVLGEVDCVETFCRVHFEGDTLNSTGKFLDELRTYEDLGIVESEFSPNIRLDEDAGDPENPGDSPTENSVYFAMGSNRLPVNPTDFSHLDIQ